MATYIEVVINEEKFNSSELIDLIKKYNSVNGITASIKAVNSTLHLIVKSDDNLDPGTIFILGTLMDNDLLIETES